MPDRHMDWGRYIPMQDGHTQDYLYALKYTVITCMSRFPHNKVDSCNIHNESSNNEKR